ncbi:MAG: YesL family protein [Oscillospiraceae bacterium]|nr:YesL family protein [Oscillospiraceae bacterium]
MAGFFGIGDYTRAGRGIAKGEQKGRLKLFFEILEVRIWKLFLLNLIYVLACIPIITIGPATAGMFRVVKNYSIDRHAYVWQDFKQGFKENFFKALIMGIIDIIAYTGIVCGVIMYSGAMVKSADSGRIVFLLLLAATLSAGLTFTIMNYYIYLMMVSTTLNMKAIISNSVKFAFLSPKQNFTAVLCNIGLPLLIFTPIVLVKNLQPLLTIIFPFAPIAIIAFVISFCCYPAIQKYVIDPYYNERGEKNPEKALDEPADGEEILFEDMGGKEKPYIPKEKKGKGKVIS